MPSRLADRVDAAIGRLRWGLVRALTSRRTVRTRGLRFTLQADNWITHYRWATYNVKEPETLDWIDARIREGDVVFDVGANIGVYALYVALRHPAASVVAFEPEYSNLHLLRDNVVANGLCGRIGIYALALGDRSGLTRLHVQDLTPGAALHSESLAPLTHTRSGHQVVLEEGIAVTTIDDFCEQSGLRPNAIKIDVDGTEPEILRGARRTLRDPALRTVLIEIPSGADAAAECRQLLADGGLRRVVATGSAGNEIWSR